MLSDLPFFNSTTSRSAHTHAAHGPVQGLLCSLLIVLVNGIALADISISITPSAVTLSAGASQQFNAAVSGSSDTSVTWTANGGTITNAGLYVAPNAAGTYTVRATSVGDTSKFAEATVSVPVDLNMIAPPDGGFTGTDLRIAVLVNSIYEIQSVKAMVETRETTLVFSNCVFQTRTGTCIPGWEGSISLAGLSKGDKIVTVTAVDVRGNVGQAQRSFIYDEKPVLVVSAPLHSTVARPYLRLAATCTDDGPGGCASMKVTTVDPVTTLATGKSSINETVSLADYNGRELGLNFSATDSRGQSVSEIRIVRVESSRRLIEVDRITSDGRIDILDVQPDRILFLRGGYPSPEREIKIRQRSNGTESLIPTPAGENPWYGFLTSRGVMFVTYSTASPHFRVYEYRDGVLLSLGGANDATSLVVKGDYAIWNSTDASCDSSRLVQRNLVTATTLELTTCSRSVGNFRNDVAANGDVVYWTGQQQPVDYNIYRYQNGVTSKLTNDTTLWNVYPVTDGVNVVYTKSTPCCGNQTYATYLYGSSGEVLLAPMAPNPGSYQVSNGHFAYTRPGTSGQAQIWADGTQVTFFGWSSDIETLGANGEVAFVKPFYPTAAYLGAPGRQPVQVGFNFGKNFFQDGQWFKTVGRPGEVGGRSLFRVDQNAALNETIAISGVTVSPFVISPNGDGVNDILTVQFTLSVADRVFVDILDRTGGVIATPVNDSGLSAGTYTATWKGITSSGSVALDGTYTVRISGFSAAPVLAGFGLTNTIPEVSKSWFLAEGSTVGFDAYILVQNPNNGPVTVTVTFFRQDGTTKLYTETLPPLTRTTIPIHREVPNTFSVSSRVNANLPIIVERAMYFNGGQGGHDSIGVIGTNQIWYFPANHTFSGDEDFILIVNPSAVSATTVTATFVFEGQAPIIQTYSVGASSRFTIPVHGVVPGARVSVRLQSTLPIAAERAFYISNRAGGAAGIGAVSPSLTWYFAEGDTSNITSPVLATTILELFNPGNLNANITVNYLLEGGTVISKTYTIAAERRLSLDAAGVIGFGQRFSMEVLSDVPIVAERLMFSGTDVGDSIGSPTTAYVWNLAEGFTAFGYETWVIVSNPGNQTANVTARFLKQSGQNILANYTLPAKQRLTIYVNTAIDELTSVSTQITSDQPVVVERTMKFANRQGIHQSMGVRQ